jgi:hypothetical protein
MHCSVVGVIQQYITLTLFRRNAATPGVAVATRLLGCLRAAAITSGSLPAHEFRNTAVNDATFDMRDDYRRWVRIGVM